ncbi:uncharacterized protein EDB91DRAFT_1082107 [Suillus paluster]|uniref:uncharacterized protein n=1 Tax=Suillus paluster TaxID=48578 RepID=UPI001B86D04B|nr:uncharacterized protein EDB91DRAFT_1082107 [Suillus paluster]KAG1740129.1 hypothetical protein EDB91DRAFT_1082107 [Suillus paluster]
MQPPHTKWIPSGIAFAIGFLNSPSFSLGHLIGGVIKFIYHKLIAKSGGCLGALCITQTSGKSKDTLQTMMEGSLLSSLMLANSVFKFTSTNLSSWGHGSLWSSTLTLGLCPYLMTVLVPASERQKLLSCVLRLTLYATSVLTLRKTHNCTEYKGSNTWSRAYEEELVKGETQRHYVRGIHYDESWAPLRMATRTSTCQTSSVRKLS